MFIIIVSSGALMHIGVAGVPRAVDPGPDLEAIEKERNRKLAWLRMLEEEKTCAGPAKPTNLDVVRIHNQCFFCSDGHWSILL